jgi:hypothetical protein
MADGKSLAAVAVHYGVCRDTINEWRAVHPEFSAAIKAGLAASQQWWEDAYQKQMIENPGGSKLNTTGWIFTMKNRFREDYGDQPQVIINKTDDTKLNADIKEKLEALESKIRDGGK